MRRRDACAGRSKTVHHDIWDYDVASQPTLLDLRSKDGTIQPALVQPTKRGEIFVLNRETGQPIHPVTEVSVPQGNIVPKEYLAKTQPFSNALPSFRGPDVREADMWGITPFDQLWCRIELRSTRYAGTMTPPGTTTWSAVTGLCRRHELGQWLGRSGARRGRCDHHEADPAQPADPAHRSGTQGPQAARRRGNRPEMPVQTHRKRARRMPSPAMPSCHLCSYHVEAPPFGYISAVDLVTGKLVWSRPLGDQSGMLIGTPIIGGSITTRAGLAFIGGTIDKMFRALDLRTGKELWRANLPEGGHTVPATYLSRKSGRQFVVIAAGGAMGLGSAGDARLVAFALPQKPR